MKPMLTAERLRELLRYDPESGEFRWLVDRLPFRAGRIAGAKRKDGYVLIGIDRRLYLRHRLAWLWMTGSWPKAQVDHRDGIKGNDAWSNLRATTNRENTWNSPARRKNATGLKGVSFAKREGKWAAQIMIDGRHYGLGHFNTPEEAHASYAAAAAKHFGEFART